MSRSGLEYLRHILSEADYLLSRSGGLSRGEFMRDETVRRAFVRSLEVIGEAAKQVPDELKSKYSHVEWKAMAGMRDRIIHGYDTVDLGVVWNVVTQDIPSIRPGLRQILADYEKGD